MSIESSMFYCSYFLFSFLYILFFLFAISIKGVETITITSTVYLCPPHNNSLVLMFQLSVNILNVFYCCRQWGFLKVFDCSLLYHVQTQMQLVLLKVCKAIISCWVFFFFIFFKIIVKCFWYIFPINVFTATEVS